MSSRKKRGFSNVGGGSGIIIRDNLHPCLTLENIVEARLFKTGSWGSTASKLEVEVDNVGPFLGESKGDLIFLGLFLSSLKEWCVDICVDNISIYLSSRMHKYYFIELKNSIITYLTLRLSKTIYFKKKEVGWDSICLY